MDGTFRSGLFFNVLAGTIKNIIVSGKVESGDQSGAGMIYEVNQSYIYNCYSNITVSGMSVGGICAYSGSDNKFVNCYNIGKISGKWQDCAGGIVGRCSGNTEIYNSYNLADVEMVNGNSYACAGGIIGRIAGGTVKIVNSYNVGNITSSCHKGSLVALYASELVSVENCYYLEGTATSTVGTVVTIEQIQNKEMIEDKYIIDMLNNYVENYNSENENAADFVELKYWKIGENGYPAFEGDE